MLIAAIVCLSLWSVATGWLTICKALEDFPHRQPALYQHLGAKRINYLSKGAMLLMLAGVVLLFNVIWYAGIVGIVAAVIGPLIIAEIINGIRATILRPSTPQDFVRDVLSEHSRRYESDKRYADGFDRLMNVRDKGNDGE